MLLMISILYVIGSVSILPGACDDSLYNRRAQTDDSHQRTKRGKTHMYLMTKIKTFLRTSSHTGYLNTVIALSMPGPLGSKCFKR